MTKSLLFEHCDRKHLALWVMRISVVSLHTRFRAFPLERLAQHLPPSVAYALYLRVASTFILRCCAPVTLFVSLARRLFERACRTRGGAITPSTQARQCSNSPPVVVGAFHLGRQSIAQDFSRFVNIIDSCYIFCMRRSEILSGLL
jgi:hypothetical protein